MEPYPSEGEIFAPQCDLAERYPELALAIADFKGHAKEDSTWKQYEASFAKFKGWCVHVGERALPAHLSSVEMYLGDLAVFT